MVTAAPNPTEDPARSDTAGGRGWLTRTRLLMLLAAVFVGLVVGVLVAQNRSRLELSRAVDRTIEAGTARVAATGSVAEVPLLGDVTVTVADGEVDFVGQRARIIRDIPVLAALLGADAASSVEFVYTPDGTWMKAPFETPRPWVRVAEATGRAEGPGISAPGLGNPAVLLGVLRALAEPPEEVGTEDVRGVPSTRYRVLVDLEQVADMLPASASGWLRDIQRLLGSRNLPLDAWVGETGRIRRVRFSFPLELGGLGSVAMRTQIELFDFGTPVDITAPPPDQVADVSPERLRQLDPLRRLRELLQDLGP